MNTTEYVQIDYLAAWQAVIDLMGSSKWTPIPAQFVRILGLPGGIGGCRGNLLSEQAARGVVECINRFNRPRGKVYVK